jgi:hypothetical protein
MFAFYALATSPDLQMNEEVLTFSPLMMVAIHGIKFNQ